MCKISLTERVGRKEGRSNTGNESVKPKAKGTVPHCTLACKAVSRGGDGYRTCAALICVLELND